MSTKDVYALFEQARKVYNPFKLDIVAAEEVWGEVITDLPSLNQHIDQTIFSAISEIQRKDCNKISITIKGDRGTGKSHVIHRVWKKITQDGGAVFSYIAPYTNPRRINSHVRFHLAESFKRRNIQGDTQWQKLAAAAIRTLKGTDSENKYQPYIERCDSPNTLRKYILDNQNKDTLGEFFNELIEAILENQTGTDLIDYNFLKATLFLILGQVRLAQIAYTWIKGEEHSEIEKIGLPKFTLEDQEEKAIWMIAQICTLAKIASLPVLICFDQIDNGGTDADSGDSPAQNIAKCIDKIYFQCSNVMLISCLTLEASRSIEQMGSGIPDRVFQRPVLAKPPNAEQMIELVKLRLDYFYKKNGLNSHDYPELYPFEKAKIKKAASESAGVRSLMKWCSEEFEKKVDTSPNPPEKKFLDIYHELIKKIQIPIKEDDKLAAIIACGMKMIPDGGTENVVINGVEKISHASHDLHLTVSGYDSLNKCQIKIGIRVSETTNGHTFNAVMKRLLEYKNYRITRGCLVRSTPIPASWRVGHQLKEELQNKKGGEVVILKKDQIKPLVVIERIYEEAENYGFTKEQVTQFVKNLRLTADNLLICEILSAPIVK